MIASGRRRTFLLFGDSLTQRAFECGGWGARLAHLLSRKADIICRGFGAYNTRWCRHVVRHIGSYRDYFSVVTVLLGTNDAALPDVEPVQAVPLDEYVENLDDILKYLRNRSEFVILFSPPSVGELGRLRAQHHKYVADAHDWLDRNNLHSAKYACVAKVVAENRALLCVDMFRLTSVQLFLGEKLLIDGIHFTATGNLFLLKSLLHELRAEAHILSAENMRPDWPYGPWMQNSAGSWREILIEHELETSHISGDKFSALADALGIVSVFISAFLIGLSVSCRGLATL